MSSTVAHVPAPPPKRVVGRRVGGASDGPVGLLNDRKANDKQWAKDASRDHKQANALLAEAALMRQRTHQSATQSRKEVQEQGRVVFDNLTKKVKLLKNIRHKLQTADSKLTRANDNLAAARIQASELATRLERPLQKCTARSQLRLKRPGGERVNDDVAHAVQTQAEGIASFIQRLQTYTIGAQQLEDENSRQLTAIRGDIQTKTAAIAVEEDCLALNGKATVGTPRSMTGLTPMSGEMTPRLDDGGAAAAGTTPNGSTLQETDVIQHAGRNAPAGAMQWQQRTSSNLERAQQLLDQTVEHTTRMISFMAKVRKEHSSLNSRTKDTLALKSLATKKQEAQLSEQLDRLQDEIDTLFGQRQAITADIEARQEPLQIAKRRLDARRARPGAENVRDAVEIELEKEFLLLAASIQSLEEKKRQVDAEASRLRQAHSRLRQKSMHKQCALALDQQCLELDDLSQYNLSARGSVRSSTSSARGATPRSDTSSRPSSRRKRGSLDLRGAGSTGSDGGLLPPVRPNSGRGGPGYSL